MAAPQTIGVLTFHRCINYGSYWQARCLVEGLRAQGRDAVLLEHASRAVDRAELRCAFQPRLPERTPRGDFPAYARKVRRFRACFDALPQSAPFDLDRPETMPAVDALIVGSDEVWNFRHPWYASKSLFFGAGVPAGRRVSFAASFGNHDAADGIHPHWAELLGGFDAISVRDANARALIEGALGFTPTTVLDPCLTFPEAIRPGPPEARAPYLLVYGNSFPDWFAGAVRAEAHARNLRLVSVGYRNEWADEQAIDVGPLEFARLMADAAAVATTYFHGCVFALVNDKPFACTASPYRRNKLRDLTEEVGAAPHLVEEDGAGRIGALLEQPLAPEIGQRIAALRAQSRAFLSRALA